MKSILDYSRLKKKSENINSILDKSLEHEVKEDRTIKIITKEITDFIIQLFNSNDENK